VDMIPLFNEFYNGDMDVKRINYGIITLLPKVKEVENTTFHIHYLSA
jgi:hypothetical protein